MLKKKLHSLPPRNTEWLPEPQGVFFPFVCGSEKPDSQWSIQINEKQKSGRFPAGGELAGVSAAINGGPARYVLKNRERQIQPEISWKWSGEENGQLYLVSPLTLFSVIYDPRSVRAAIYPTYVKSNEEVQFPVLGAEHFIYVVSGNACWIDRESDDSKQLQSGQMLQVTRSDFKKEYLNLKLKGLAEKTTALWVVLHHLPDHKRT